VIHVNWYEADAYCRWAGRRLPTEAEWEAAAAGPDPKRRFPWGDEPPDPTRANLDGTALGCCDVAACPAGDSGFGCRQMFGNVWEWTASDFGPYPGFVPDPYKEYSQPWFGTHKVLRGGAWPTRARLLRTTWRNFYTPDRRDVWAGFRTCAVG
jgi:iron(II)-dependent oxidoreductase